MSADPSKPVHIFRLPIGWILLGAFGLNLIFLLLVARSPVTMSETSAGFEFRSSAHIYMQASMFTLAIITGCIGIMFSSYKGIFRFYGIAMFAITAWIIYSTATTDTSHHHVLATDSTVTCIVGTKSKPDSYTIDFSNAAYLSIVKVDRSSFPSFDLIAIDQNGQESRIPMNELMRAALPKMLEIISRYDIALGESESGGFVPSEL